MTDAANVAADALPIGLPKEAEHPPPFLEQVKSFARPFWAANVMEMIERLAYYGVRVVIPIYIASTEDPAGLHFTNVQKGTILTIWAFIQTLLPMFTGGYADRYGRKPTIAVSIAIKIMGYLLMATQRSFGGFLLGCATLAAGTAVFKPGVQGTLVCGTTRKNSSVGWGIFYQVVNIGGFLGPPLAGYLHHYAWKWVFFACAAIVSVNFVTLFTYEDKPAAEEVKDAKPGEEKAPDALTKGSPWEVFAYSMKRLFRPRLISLMFMQLYDMLPNFIEEWTDSANVVAALGLHQGQLAQPTPRGLQVPQEWMINLDAGAIVLFMLVIAYLGARMRRLVAIFVGIFIASAGLLMAGISMSGWLCLLGILTFAVGEMTASPKMNEYLGVIAPKGEEALYMGYANIPFAIGWTAADYLGGVAYDRLADKANLALRYMREHALVAPDVLDHLKRTDAMKALMDATHLDARQATELLWGAYHPQTVWYPFVAVGILTSFAMVAYARVAQRWTHENA
jgi:POT family proton-dependent oligopeptide transporter